MLNTVKRLLREMIETNAARAIAYVSAALVGAVAAADAAIEAIELSPEFMVGLSAFTIVVATEAIRLAVFSLRTHEEEVAAAFVTGVEVGQAEEEAP